MTHAASLFGQMVPRWVRRLACHERPKASAPEDVDAQWREIAENDLYGANSPDYTHVPKESAQSDHPAGSKPSQ